MRYKDISLMNKIKKFAEDFFISEGHSPSTTDIANTVGSSRGTVHRYLVEMNEKGLISYDGKTIKTEITEKVQTKSNSGVPICGSIPCGSPMEEAECIDTIVSLPPAIFGTGEMYILVASGDSMKNAGIDDGDYVVVEKQTTASEGEIVAALVDNESTLKRFYHDKENNQVILRPENEKYSDIIAPSCEIQGVAKYVIKALT